jgi:hypothetical protein
MIKKSLSGFATHRLHLTGLFFLRRNKLGQEKRLSKQQMMFFN